MTEPTLLSGPSLADHPFWRYALSHLRAYDLSWFGSYYITNMFSVGCHFFSTMHLFFRWTSAPRVSASYQLPLLILPSSYKLNGHVTTPLFEHLGASSWHREDAAMIGRLGKVVEEVKVYAAGMGGCVLAVVAVVAVVVLGVRWARWARWARWGRGRGGSREEDVEKGGPGLRVARCC